MIEKSMTFTELVSHYGLARSEGLVLRYLADAYRALRQTVPDAARTEELEDLTEWLGELIRQVDSSLLDEWEQLANPGVESDDQQLAFGADTPRPISANTRAFKVMIRNAMFKRVELASRKRWDDLAALGDGLESDDWADLLELYFDEYDEIGTGPDARGPGLFSVATEPTLWRVRQTLADPAGDHGWALIGEVNLAESDAAGEVVFDEFEIVEG